MTLTMNDTFASASDLLVVVERRSNKHYTKRLRWRPRWLCGGFRFQGIVQVEFLQLKEPKALSLKFDRNSLLLGCEVIPVKTQGRVALVP